MRNVALMILVALMSSLMTVGIFKYFDKPEKIIIREPIPKTQPTNTTASNFGRVSPSPTILATTPTDFVTAATAATPAVVYIRTLHRNKDGFWKYKYYGIVRKWCHYFARRIHRDESSCDRSGIGDSPDAGR